MYLSINQHDDFRTLPTLFEILFRPYIACKILTDYADKNFFETAREITHYIWAENLQNIKAKIGKA